MDKRIGNKGVTLLEVMIVVAIIAAAAGIITMTFSVVNAVTASSCAKSLDASLEKVRTEALSKKEAPYLVMFSYNQDGETGYYVTTTNSPEGFTKNISEASSIAGSNMKITISFQNGTVLDASDETVLLTFDRSSGAMEKCLILKEDGSLEEKDFITSIQITGKGRESTIRVVAETGKHYVE